MLAERLQYEENALIFRACIEFAVRKRACAALAELHVAAWIQLARLPEGVYGRLTFFYRAAAL